MGRSEDKSKPGGLHFALRFREWDDFLLICIEDAAVVVLVERNDSCRAEAVLCGAARGSDIDIAARREGSLRSAMAALAMASTSAKGKRRPLTG